MQEIIKFTFRLAFMPVVLLMLGLTAFLEWLSRKPDWQCWRGYNRELIDMLPFKAKHQQDKMKIQLRVFGYKLTPEQEAQEERAFDAAKMLRYRGYKARAVKYVVTSPKDRAAGIEIE